MWIHPSHAYSYILCKDLLFYKGNFVAFNTCYDPYTAANASSYSLKIATHGELPPIPLLPLQLVLLHRKCHLQQLLLLLDM